MQQHHRETEVDCSEEGARYSRLALQEMAVIICLYWMLPTCVSRCLLQQMVSIFDVSRNWRKKVIKLHWCKELLSLLVMYEKDGKILICNVH